MINKKIQNLQSLTVFLKVLPITVVLFFLVTSWNSILNLYNGVTEGGYKTYEFRLNPEKVYTLKLDLTTNSLIEAAIEIVIMLSSIQLFSWLNYQKIEIINDLIEQIIDNELNIEELMAMRLYFAEHPNDFKNQLKLVNARLSIRIQ
jgi:hypothetical protein